MTGVAGVILAGGRNSRMGGTDKAFLTVGGQTVVARTVGVLRQVCEQIVIVSNSPERYAGFDVEITHDRFPSHGPLAGMHAGLMQVRAPWAFVVACDMPFLRVEPIRHLQSRLDDSDAVVPWWDGDVEPLHAFYATRIHTEIAGILQAGSGAVRDLLRAIDVTYVPEAEMSRIAGSDESFRNVNTPEEAERYAVQR